MVAVHCQPCYRNFPPSYHFTPSSPSLSPSTPLSITSSPPELDQLGQTSAPARHQINMNFISLKPFETPTQSQCNLMANSSYQEWSRGGTVFKAFAGETNIWKCQYKLEQSSLWLQTSLIVNDQIMFTTRAPTGLVTNGSKEVLMPIVSLSCKKELRRMIEIISRHNHDCSGLWLGSNYAEVGQCIRRC